MLLTGTLVKRCPAEVVKLLPESLQFGQIHLHLPIPLLDQSNSNGQIINSLIIALLKTSLVDFIPYGFGSGEQKVIV